MMINDVLKKLLPFRRGSRWWKLFETFSFDIGAKTAITFYKPQLAPANELLHFIDIFWLNFNNTIPKVPIQGALSVKRINPPDCSQPVDVYKVCFVKKTTKDYGWKSLYNPAKNVCFVFRICLCNFFAGK